MARRPLLRHANAEIRPERADLSTKHRTARRFFSIQRADRWIRPPLPGFIGKAETGGRDLVFLVGGHDGLPAGWAARADLLLSLSPITLSHELARVMLAEQIYRGFATLRGHPYPR